MRGIHLWPVNSPHNGPVTRSFDVFFYLRLNKRLSKQSWGWWFETLSGPLWRHCNVLAPRCIIIPQAVALYLLYRMIVCMQVGLVLSRGEIDDTYEICYNVLNQHHSDAPYISSVNTMRCIYRTHIINVLYIFYMIYRLCFMHFYILYLRWLLFLLNNVPIINVAVICNMTRICEMNLVFDILSKALVTQPLTDSNWILIMA